MTAAASESPLLAILRARIRRDGPLPIDQFMQACLVDPEHGYWQKAASIGAGGDFITAPEISQTFGELIGLWCAVVWQSMGAPAGVRLIELGPGRGTLMRDALRAAGKVPAFLGAVSIHMVEISAPMRDVQRKMLPPPRNGERNAPPIAWHASLADVPDGPAIIIGNEFLDALPIRQLVLGDGVWRERVVEVDERGQLRLGVGAPVRALERGPATPAAIVELRAGEEALLAQIAARQGPQVALLIDYGPAHRAFGDTLQAVRRHAYVDPLAFPGEADLTAHVQFARLAEKARERGFAASGPITQAEFLGALGIAERAARLMAANPERAGEIEAGVQRLMAPTGMGGLFKAIAIHSAALPPPPPFG